MYKLLVPGLVLWWTLFAAACSPSSPVAMETPKARGPTVEAEPREPEPTVLPIATPTPIGAEHSWTDERHFGKAVASIEERLFLADVVVRARFASASNGTISFRAVEYLKGNGRPTFSVKAKTEGRSTQWDDREALLFLSLSDTSAAAPGGGPILEFTDTTKYDYWPDYWPEGRPASSAYAGDRSDGYDVLSNNPVWLPAEEVDGKLRDFYELRYLDAGLGVEPISTDTVSLRSIVHALDRVTYPVDDWWWSDEQFEAYDGCVRVALHRIRNDRDLRAYWGKPTGSGVTEIEREIMAGAPQRAQVDSIDGADVFSHDGPGWKAWPHRWHGPNDDLFLFEFGEAYSDYGSPVATMPIWPLSEEMYTDYGLKLTTTRPLPAGTYEVRHSLSPWYTRCGSPVPIDYFLDYVVTVKPVEHILHETLWDAGKPLSDPNFRSVHNNTEATLRGIDYDYEDRQVEIDISPPDAFAGQDIEFIELDGTVGLRLNAEAAAVNGTVLSWPIDRAPWTYGDRYLVRIRSDGFVVPTQAQATSNVPGEVTVTWKGGLNATRYTISLNGEGYRFGIQEAGLGAPASSHTFTGVSTGLYSVSVTAIKEYGSGSIRNATVASNWVEVEAAE